MITVEQEAAIEAWRNARRDFDAADSDYEERYAAIAVAQATSDEAWERRKSAEAVLGATSTAMLNALKETP